MICRTLPRTLLLCAGLWCGLSVPSFAATLPSTFGSTVGAGLLCKDHLDPYYFFSYLKQFAGQPYKAEGGAYWFKVQGNVWGVDITDVLVSDGKGEQVFLAARFKAAPAKLADAVAGSTGVVFVRESSGAEAPLVSPLGGRIVFAGANSTLYCKQYNLDYARSHPH